VDHAQTHTRAAPLAGILQHPVTFLPDAAIESGRKKEREVAASFAGRKKT
jgi:hypothetical protein